MIFLKIMILLKINLTFKIYYNLGFKKYEKYVEFIN